VHSFLTMRHSASSAEAQLQQAKAKELTAAMLESRVLHPPVLIQNRSKSSLLPV
jgi:hypothetical protein